MLWVPTPERAWALARAVRHDMGEWVTVELIEGGGSLRVRRVDTHLMDETHLENLDDLCVMNGLHEGPLLDILRRRFCEDKIYTHSSDVLISVNPYREIPGLYDSPLRYYTPDDDDDDDDDENDGEEQGKGRILPPHVYGIADNALQFLRGKSHASDQSIIISGESGAGKTEAAKFCTAFLISANEATCAVAESETDLGSHMKEVLLHSSVVFEAFGNAKTVRNDNSSRFGKYVKLQYTDDNMMVSATTETFLLETSRLVSVAQGERNYHIFYQVIAGLSPADRARYFSTSSPITVQSFKILIDGGTTVVTTEAADASAFASLQGALVGLGSSTQELDALWILLAAVLHLGNTTAHEAAEGSADNEVCHVACSSTSLETISTLLGVPEVLFLDCVRTQTLKAGRRGSTSRRVLSPEDCHFNISALLKFIYKGVFSWLLEKVNTAHALSPVLLDKVATKKFIGVLDIFGFEILQRNSLEQLLINFTNERLQQQFNEHIFGLEQDRYALEGLNWSSITFKDNQQVIDLIGKKPFGLLQMLEEHSILNRKPDDIALFNSLVSVHGGSKAGSQPHPAFSKSRFGNDGFLVRHFAGEVSYELEGFIAKNNDSLQDDLFELLAMSSNSFLRAAVCVGSLEPHEVGFLPGLTSKMTVSIGDGGDGGKEAGGHKILASSITVSQRFRDQLDQLVQTIKLTRPHYIKCIKSNPNKSTKVFTSSLVLEQLRYSGVIEVVRIRREGYPTRLTYANFYSKHKILGFKYSWLEPKDPSLTDTKVKEYCQILASTNLAETEFQFGNNLIFMREGALVMLQKATERFLVVFAIKIQSQVRCAIEVKRFKELRQKIIRAQAVLRMLGARKKFSSHVAERQATEQRIEEERRRIETIRIKEEQDRAETERLARMEHEARVAFLAEKARVEEELCVARLKSSRCIQKFVRFILGRRQVLRRAAQLHHAAATGDVATIKSSAPADLALLTPGPRFRTLQHTALMSNQVSILKLLGWNRPVTGQSLFKLKDAFGNSLLHLACMAQPVLKIITIAALSEAADSLLPPPAKEVTIVGKDKTLQSSDDTSIVRDKHLKSGWLRKKKDGRSYRRRWCILTQDKLSYFKLPGDSVPKGVVPLLGCTFRRVTSGPNAEGPCFALSSTLITKPSFFGISGGVADKPQVIYFMADSEADLLQWITPIR